MRARMGPVAVSVQPMEPAAVRRGLAVHGYGLLPQSSPSWSPLQFCLLLAAEVGCIVRVVMVPAVQGQPPGDIDDRGG